MGSRPQSAKAAACSLKASGWRCHALSGKGRGAGGRGAEGDAAESRGERRKTGQGRAGRAAGRKEERGRSPGSGKARAPRAAPPAESHAPPARPQGRCPRAERPEGAGQPRSGAPALLPPSPPSPPFHLSSALGLPLAASYKSKMSAIFRGGRDRRATSSALLRRLPGAAPPPPPLPGPSAAAPRRPLTAALRPPSAPSRATQHRRGRGQGRAAPPSGAASRPSPSRRPAHLDAVRGFVVGDQHVPVSAAGGVPGTELWGEG